MRIAASHIIGIDLGTTNCAVAYARPEDGPGASVEDFPIPQLQRPGEVASLPLLSSCLYVPGEHELPPGSAQLPWAACGDLIIGEFARWQGSRVPGRLVASAKSWLCHPGVDRSAPILPWGSLAEVNKISPVDASALLLGQMAAAWDHAHPESPISGQEVVITVPASFDEAARALTVSAAQKAGLKQFTLVEEPQAAFYDFTSRHRNDLADALKDIRLALVVDVGGGTTDFTLIQVGVSTNGPLLRRIAVGDHLMLGGDNMDAALSRLVEDRFGGRKLSASQWTQLTQASRAAKESLLGLSAPVRHGIALVSEGSRLLGGALSTELKRDEAERVILDGFFPATAPDELPRRAARVALQELGLPYAQDPAITRHMAAFLRAHAAAGFEALGTPVHGAEGSTETVSTTNRSTSITSSWQTGDLPHKPPTLPRPDAILLNGGVFNSPKIAERLVSVISSWWPQFPPIQLLAHDSLELAVARGAVYYGLVRRGLGRRIGGGAAHALYVGLAVGKDSTVPQAVCLIPRGQEEGQPVELTSRPFTLTLGKPVQFPLFSTSSDRPDHSGDIVSIDDEEFRQLPPIHTLFKSSSTRTATVPVHLRATLTELGTLELWCVSNAADERWRLEFELRRSAGPASTLMTVTESMPPRFAEACAVVERVFGKQPQAVDARDVKQLSRSIEKIIGSRETWRLPLLREIWSILIAGAKHRRRSSDHERVYLQLIGYSLRPGFGYPLDEWRCEQTFSLFSESIKFHKEQPIWNEFWVLWRRIAGGLDETGQYTLWNYLKPYLAKRIASESLNTIVKPAGIQPEGLDEMVRVAASLEHLAPSEKAILGGWITTRLQRPDTTGGPWAWVLGRLGTRVPLYGSGHKTVPPELAGQWVELLLTLGLDRIDNAAFSCAQLARLTADRTRNVEDQIRLRLVDALRAAAVPPTWLRMISEITDLDAADEARALGDTLPIGLQVR